jgi:hypothetical protein
MELVLGDFDAAAPSAVAGGEEVVVGTEAPPDVLVRAGILKLKVLDSS